MMVIQHMDGEEDLVSDHVLRRVLSLRTQPANANHYWICHKDRPFPALSVHVKGNLAHLNYMPSDDDPGVISSGNQCGLPEGLIEFPSSGDPIEVPAHAVVPWSTAEEAIVQYLKDASLLDTVEWLRL